MKTLTIEDANRLMNKSKNGRVAIANTFTSIDDFGFYGRHALKSIEIPNSVKSIGIYAFEHCHALTSLTIPKSVTTIGKGAFRDCRDLTSLTVEATTPPTLGTDALDGTPSDMEIFVPAESVNTYKAAAGWSAYASQIFPIA